MTSHSVEILAALALTAVLPGTAMARVFPPHSDCTTYSGNARISCNKQMGNMQRSGAKTPELGATQPGATQPGATSAPSGSTAGSASITGSSITGNAANGAQQAPAQTGHQGGTQNTTAH